VSNRLLIPRKRRFLRPCAAFGAPFAFGGATGIFNGSPAAVTGTPPITFSSVSFGGADASRVVVAAVFFASSTNNVVSGVTIGGVTATKVVDAGFTNWSAGGGAFTGDTGATLWAAAVPTGTSGNIVVSGPAVSTACAVSCYSVYGSGVTPLGTLTNATGSVSNSAGVVIGFAANHTGSFTWTALTADVNTSVGLSSGSMFYSSASVLKQAANPLSVSVSPTAGTNFGFAGW